VLRGATPAAARRAAAHALGGAGAPAVPHLMSRLRATDAEAELAMGGKVIFIPPCLFCMDNHG
jgi:hypothetical protein